ncbi:MAG: hypothetical protein JW846_06185 [Dehalococcoidia bacterium]|nr:hypothetical protein [Dehalococcoidia bacterium]
MPDSFETRKESGFSEQRVHEAFRRVRNRLVKYDPDEVVFRCIAKLNERPSDPVRQLESYPPWRLLLLAKWALVHGEVPATPRRLTERAFDDLNRRMWDLEGVLRLPSEYETLLLWLKGVAFQQFGLQREFNRTTFSRQSLLFGPLKENHKLKAWFSEQCGITIGDFVDLSALLMVALVGDERKSVSVDELVKVFTDWDRSTVERYLDLLGPGLAELRLRLREEQNTSLPVSLEYYESSPLRRTPLLKHNGRYFPFSPVLLARSLETFIYDTLSEADRYLFLNLFWKVFQRYVGSSVLRLGGQTLAEGDLKKLPGKGKVVDYLCLDGSLRVLVEAKAVEMPYSGKVGPRAETVKRATRNSVLKGIEQGFDTIARLRGQGDAKEAGNSHFEDYLLIVTYKDLFMGNGVMFRDAVARDKLNEMVALHDGEPPIPFDHIYIMSIDDFDLLAETIAKGRASLADVLRHAVDADSSSSTRKYTFEQHIMAKCPGAQFPEWLVCEFHDILNRNTSGLVETNK